MITDDILRELGGEFVIHCTDESMIDAIYKITCSYSNVNKELVLESLPLYGNDIGVRIIYDKIYRYDYVVDGYSRIGFYRDAGYNIIEFDSLYSKRNEDCCYEIKDDDFFRLLGATD